MMGPVSLRYYLIDRGLAIEDLAVLIDASYESAVNWANGRARPSLKHQHILLSVAGIQLHEWLRAAEKAYLEKTRLRIMNLRRRRPLEKPDRIDTLAGRI
jgi:ribosome-binding protein aMBF1 (putative translation factor)